MSNDCQKRQKERAGDKLVHRCVNRRAEQFKELVTDDVCDGCPVKVLLKSKSKKTALPVYQPAEEGYPTCQWRANGSCMATGLEINKEICNRCDQEAADTVASSGQKLANYTTAVRRWIAAGRPTRSDAEVDKLFHDNCRKCKRYDAATKSCASCGCAVKAAGFPLTNKLKMKTEECPLGRF